MRSETCKCGGALFFGDTQCLLCERQVVLCPTCRRTAAVETQPDGTVVCQTPECGEELLRCRNAVQYGVCNGSVVKVERGEPGFNFCRYCRLNQVIPQLQVAGNLFKWAALEEAKHRVLAGFEQVGFSLDAAAATAAAPLRFQFKESGAETVTTGHWNGVITIRLAEADSVFREQRRIQFGESKRTLTDHFRHELGHYVWDWLVKPNRLAEFRELFGNETAPPYQQAMDNYYANGSPADWKDRCVTEYASMHPWEDFAETFRVFLEMEAALASAVHFGFLNAAGETFTQRMTTFLRLGVGQNELARDFGFDDLVAENFRDPVVAKLKFISKLPELVVGTHPPLAASGRAGSPGQPPPAGADDRPAADGPTVATR